MSPNNYLMVKNNRYKYTPYASQYKNLNELDSPLNILILQKNLGGIMHFSSLFFAQVYKDYLIKILHSLYKAAIA
jgi:hypothetical protein